MSWGINPNAPQHEKIFTEFADNLGGMNSCGVIDYNAYSEIWDMAREMFEKAYEQGKNDAKNQWKHKSEFKEGERMKYRCPNCGTVSDEKDIPVNPMLLPDDNVCKCPECGEWDDLENWEEVSNEEQ